MFLQNKQCFDDQSLYYLSISSGVKITQQGFLFFDSAAMRLSEPSYPCNRTLNALCAHGNYTFLPCTRQPLTMLTDAPPPFDQFWRNEARCSKFPSLHELHVTPCDLRSGTSIVWSEGTVAVQHDLDMAYWPSLFALLIMTWLIVNLGETIALILEVKGSTAHNHNTVALCAALVAIIVACTPQSLWATDHDLALYWCTVGYIGLYGLYHLKNQNTINIIVGCLILVSARFYQTNETPYVATFLFLIAARFFQKACYACWGKSSLSGACWAWLRFGFMATDVAFFALLYTYSFVPACKEPTQAHLFLLGILFAAVCLGMFIANFVRSKAAAAGVTSTSTEEE